MINHNTLPLQNATKPLAIDDSLIESIKASKNNLMNQKSPPKFPCGSCNLEVRHNDKAIFCTSCTMGTTVGEYKLCTKRNYDTPELVDSEEWVCLHCTVCIRNEMK